MARGKHKRSKNSKDRAALENVIIQARAVLAREESLLESAKDKAARADAARAELRDSVAERDAACEPEIRRATNAREVAAHHLRELRETRRAVRHHWDRYVGEMIRKGGSTVDVQERLLYATSGDPEARITMGKVRRTSGLTTAQIDALQHVRGERARSSAGFATDAQRERIAESEKIFSNCRREGLHPVETLLSVHPYMFVDMSTLTEGAASTALGAVAGGGRRETTAEVDIPDTPAQVITAAERDGLAVSRDVHDILGKWSVSLADFYGRIEEETRVPRPDRIPEFPTPPDAVALRGWYAAAGWGPWIRGEEIAGTDHRRVTVAAGTAVPYWLPPGHTVAYLDSEPLDGGDVDDIRLPYPSVFVSLADPITLPASRDADDPELVERLTWLDEAARSMTMSDEAISERRLLSLATAGFNFPRLDVATVLDHWDLRIEGVILLGDDAGVLDDLFAWCVALTSPSGNVLSRILVPAKMTSTEYRQQVLGLAAVVAWGDWHDPQTMAAGTDTEAPGHGGDTDEADQFVKILNIKDTQRRGADGAGRGAGSSVSPHIRRGHWRRQRYGTGLSQVRRVRIAPTLVNAAGGGWRRACTCCRRCPRYLPAEPGQQGRAPLRWKERGSSFPVRLSATLADLVELGHVPANDRGLAWRWVQGVVLLRVLLGLLAGQLDLIDHIDRVAGHDSV